MILNFSEIAGKQIAWISAGTGAPLVLLHCSSASHKEWRPLIEALPADRYRAMAPDLYGYGQSASYEASDSLESGVDKNIVHHLLALADEPAQLVAHSYGAAMAMEAMREQPHKVKKAILVEPVCFHLLKHEPGCEREWQRADRLASVAIGAAQAGRTGKATAAYMGYWIGHWRWWLTPRKIKQKFASTIDKVAAEFNSIYEMQHQLRDYQHIASQVHLVYGEKTTAEAKKIIQLLDSVLPESAVHCIAGAGHMCPLTHSQQVNELVLRLLEE